MKRTIILPLLAAVSLALALLAPADAAPRRRCFAQTGFCIASPILEYWERNGGLQRFGYPLGVVRTESAEGCTGPSQWFERTRLEDHGLNGVMAGRVGVLFLLTQGRLWESFPRVSQAAAGCRFFPETGHSLCGAFLTYWERNGGLARFGFPITEPAVDAVFGYDGVAQLFERAHGVAPGAGWVIAGRSSISVVAPGRLIAPEATASSCSSPIIVLERLSLQILARL